MNNCCLLCFQIFLDFEKKKVLNLVGIFLLWLSYHYNNIDIETKASSNIFLNLNTLLNLITPFFSKKIHMKLYNAYLIWAKVAKCNHPK